MAIDSEAKRKSSTHFVSPFFPQLIPPDGTIAQGDRQAAAWCYSGILAVVGVPTGKTGQKLLLLGVG